MTRGQLHKTEVLAPLSMWRLLFSSVRLPIETFVERAMKRAGRTVIMQR